MAGRGNSRPLEMAFQPFLKDRFNSHGSKDLLEPEHLLMATLKEVQ